MSRCDLSKVTQLVGGRAGLIMPTTLVVREERSMEVRAPCALGVSGRGKVVLVQQLAAPLRTTPGPHPPLGPRYRQLPLVTLYLRPLSPPPRLWAHELHGLW